MQTRVYRNLNNGRWSLKQQVAGKWIVVGHCEACVIDGALPFVSIKSRTRCVAKKQREVHAWVEGTLSRMPSGFVSFQGRPVSHRGMASDPFDAYYDQGWVEGNLSRSIVTYHPFERDCFFYYSGLEYTGSRYAVFGFDKKMRVS